MTAIAIRLKIGHANQQFEERSLAPGKYLLGRESCDIVLIDENVSARHAELHVQAHGVGLAAIQITDLASRNGTFDPHGQRLSAPYRLVPNQTIRLGASSLTWLEPLPTVAASGLAQVEQRRRSLGLWLFWTGTLLGGLLAYVLFLQPLLEAGDAEELGAMFTGALLAIPAGLVYLTVPRLLDRFDPEPWYALCGCLLWGALAAVGFSALINTAVVALATALGGAKFAAFAGAVVSAPLVEEFWKGLGVLGVFLFLRREFDGVIDGIMYATFTAIGFATIENVTYYASAAEGGDGMLQATFVMRGILSPWCHPVFTSMTGIGLGLARESTHRRARWLAPLGGYLAAVALHGFWNGVATLQGFVGAPLLAMTLPLWALFVLSFFGLVVVLVVRRSRIIRHFLQDEIHMGNLTRADVQRVCHPLGLFRARVEQGPAGVEFLRAAARLALSKWHFARAAQAKKLTLSADFIVPLRQQLATYRQLAAARARPVAQRGR
jgi:RsiW-degrading membrane proteinase PrsW (M82 family)